MPSTTRPGSKSSTGPSRSKPSWHPTGAADVSRKKPALYALKEKAQGRSWMEFIAARWGPDLHQRFSGPKESFGVLVVPSCSLALQRNQVICKIVLAGPAGQLVRLEAGECCFVKPDDFRAPAQLNVERDACVMKQPGRRLEHPWLRPKITTVTCEFRRFH